MHVATIAATICKGLNQSGWKLDPELAFAIGLGHDLGHAPFGHAGERTLDSLLGGRSSFVHEVNSYRVVEHLSNEGKGLNLTYAVKDGILCHNGEKFEQSLVPVQKENILDKIKDRKSIPSSFEGCVARFSDKVAYFGRDIEDALIANLIDENQIPPNVKKLLGEKNGEIIDSLVDDIIETSKNNDKISFSDDVFKVVLELKTFNYEFIYAHEELKNYSKYCEDIIQYLFNHLIELYSAHGQDFEAYSKSHLKLDRLFGRYLRRMDTLYTTEGHKAKRIVCDYVSGMTDGFALNCFCEITVPRSIEFNKKV
jgi:dGTPase